VLLLATATTVRWLDHRSGEAGGSSLPEFAAWRLRALGPSPFTASAIKPAFAKTSNLLSVIAPDPLTDAHSIFLLRHDGGEPLQLTHDMEVRGPTPEFTADDSAILFTRFRTDAELGLVPDVWRLPLPAGNPSLLVKNASAASTSPDGRRLVYAAVTAGGTSIRIRNQDGRELEIAEHGFWPRWSPDGSWIAFTTSDPEGGEGTIHVVRPDGPEHRELTSTPSQHYGLCWTPDSSRVIFASKQGGPTTLWSVDVGAGEPGSVTRGPGICTSPTMAADGRRLVFSYSHRRWHLFLATSVDEPARQILVTPGVQAAALSPDGSHVALAEGAEGQSPAVSVLDLDTMVRRIVSGMSASTVSWTPDGESLLVAAPAPDRASAWIWRMGIGGGLPEPIMVGEAHWRSPRASPDGSMVAALRRSAPGWELVVRHLDRGEERVVARRSVIEAPRWSPDGRYLAWSGSQRPEDMDSGGVWVCESTGGTPRRVALDGAWPLWEQAGTHLLFGRFLHERGIWRVPLSGGAPELVRALDSEMEGLYLEGLDTGRDGSPILFNLARYTVELYALEPPDEP
jgi:Tol biopolymer transport system component